jgi:hypothetical protein
MKDVADDLRAEVRRATERLRGLSESDAVASRGDGKWTRREILGHLVDSATNNHQRFVRTVCEPVCVARIRTGRVGVCASVRGSTLG